MLKLSTFIPDTFKIRFVTPIQTLISECGQSLIFAAPWSDSWYRSIDRLPCLGIVHSQKVFLSQRCQLAGIYWGWRWLHPEFRNNGFLQTVYSALVLRMRGFFSRVQLAVLEPGYPYIKTTANRPLQNEAKYTTFLVKVSFICMRMKNHLHVKGWALNLALIQKPEGTWKWPIASGGLWSCHTSHGFFQQKVIISQITGFRAQLTVPKADKRKSRVKF